MPLAPPSSSQTSPGPRRGIPRLQVQYSEMLPFVSTTAWELDDLELRGVSSSDLFSSSGPAVAVAPPPPKMADPVPIAAAPKVNGAAPFVPVTVPRQAAALPNPEVPPLTPPRPKLNLATQPAPFLLAPAAQQRFNALPFRPKLVMKTDAELRSEEPVGPGIVATAVAAAPVPVPESVTVAAPAKTGSKKKDDRKGKGSAKGKVQAIRTEERTPEAGVEAEPEREADTGDAEIAVPGWGHQEQAPKSGLSAVSPFVWIMIVVVLGAGYGLYSYLGKTDKPAQTDTSSLTELGANGKPIGGDGWLTDFSEGAGAAKARQLTIYRATVGLENYRMNFTAKVLGRGLGWVVRSKDMKNYYGFKLDLGYGSTEASLYRFAVVNGEEGPRIKLSLPITVKAGTLVSVSTVARGPQISTYVQGQNVDVWGDTRLTSGAVGFLRERGDDSVVTNTEILK